MQNGTKEVGYGEFYDSGGPDGDYGHNEDLHLTLKPI
jgi:hypothetical protein